MAVVKLKARKTETGDEEDLVLSPMDRPIRRSWMAPKVLLIVAGLIGAFAIAAYTYFYYGLTRSVDIDATRVTVSLARAGTFNDYIPVTGNIAPQETVYLDSIEGGKVTEVLVEEGVVVVEGQTLVRLKNTDLQLEAVGREAQYTEQINNLANARLSFRQNELRHKRDLIDTQYQIDMLSAQLERRKPLLATGGVPAAEVEDLEVQLAYHQSLKAAIAEAQEADKQFQSKQIAQLEQSIERLTISLALARENLESLTITAPIAGQLTALNAHVGEAVARGRRIGRIDQMDGFKVSAHVDEFYLGRVAPGQTAGVEINDRTYPLEVTKVYPDVNSRQFEVDLAFTSKTPPILRRGQTVRLRLELGEAAPSLLLANGAFYEETGGRWVFVFPSGADYAEKRNVTLGRRNSEVIEVLAGLKEGDRIITSTYDSFRNVGRIEFQNGLPMMPSPAEISRGGDE